MKKLRNFYLILGLFAIAFAVFVNIVPGIRPEPMTTAFSFARGFCWGLGVTSLIAGLVTSLIPQFYRKDKKTEKKAEEVPSSTGTPPPSDPDTEAPADASGL